MGKTQVQFLRLGTLSSPIEFKHMVTLTDKTQAMLSFPRIFKFNISNQCYLLPFTLSNQFLDFVFILQFVESVILYNTSPSSCILFFVEMHNLQKLNPKLKMSSKTLVIFIFIFIYLFWSITKVLMMTKVGLN